MALLENIQHNHPAFSATLQHRFLDDARKNSLQKFLDMGFPTKKDEEYKYTSLRQITEKDYSLFPKEEHTVSKEQIAELHLGEEDFDWIVFINGKLHTELSRISIGNTEVLSLDHALNDPDRKDVFNQYFNTIADKDLAFTNLNTAYCRHGFFLRVPKIR